MPDRSAKIFDALSGTVVRLFARLTAVEVAVDRLTEQFAAINAQPLSEEPATPPRTLTGIDVRDGSAVRFEVVAKRRRGRPKGSRNRPKVSGASPAIDLLA
jgi:hypothetical protein